MLCYMKAGGLSKLISYAIPKDLYKSTKCLTSFSLLAQPDCRSSYLQQARYKSKGKKKLQSETETEEEDADGFEDGIVDKNNKTVNVKVNSLRTDLLLKAGLGMARNKIETLFYESKIRVNGKKILKKSTQVQVGDEIDIIKGVSSTNSNFLTVARVEVLAAAEKGDNIGVKLRRCKALTIENYEEKWKSSDQS